MTSPLSGLLLQHTKHAIRQLVRYSAFSVVAVLSLVIGVGATTAVFTVFKRLVAAAALEPGRRSSRIALARARVMGIAAVVLLIAMVNVSTLLVGFRP